MRVAAPLLLAAGLVAGSHGHALAADLCDRLAVPDGFSLVCETRKEKGTRSERVVVRPEGSNLADLSQLTLRPLTREEAPLAWSEPQRWLEEQVAIDSSALTDSLTGLAAGPLAGTAGQAVLDGISTVLAGWSRLPLSGCTPEAATPHQELRCHWGPETAGPRLNVRLISDGEARYALSYWALDQRRLDHLQAIANSFHG